MIKAPLTSLTSLCVALTLLSLCAACGQRAEDQTSSLTTSPSSDTSNASAPLATLVAPSPQDATSAANPPPAATPPTDTPPLADTEQPVPSANTPADGPADTGPADTGELRAVAVTAGIHYSAMRMSDGTVRAWGMDTYGALGNAGEANDAATPVTVEGLTDAVALYTGKNIHNTSCAQTQSGAFVCWGDADQLPIKVSEPYLQTPEDMTSALKPLTSLTLGSNGFSCGINTDKLIKCWGYGAGLRLGQRYDAQTLKPPKEVTPTLAHVEEVSLGMNHACARFKKGKDSGKVACWGNNFNRQADPASSEREVYPPRGIAGIGEATRLFAWHDSSCALTADGWWCWGSNFYQGPLRFEALPADVKKLSGMNHHACAILADDSLACWGDNTYGQLGDGTHKSSPSALVKPAIGPVADVAVGMFHTCAVTKDGKGYCWGYNLRGAIGDGTLLDRASPVEVKYLNAKPLPAYERGFDAVPEGEVAMTWPDALPDGCQYMPALAAQGAGGPEPTTYSVKHAQAAKEDALKVVVTLTNYVIDTQHPDGGRPRGDQSRVIIYFTHEDRSGDKPSPLPLDVGEYAIDTQRERHFIMQHVMAAQFAVLKGDSALGADSGGVIKLTYVGDDWICGEVDMKTPALTLKGSFAAPMKKR